MALECWCKDVEDSLKHSLSHACVELYQWSTNAKQKRWRQLNSRCLTYLKSISCKLIDVTMRMTSAYEALSEVNMDSEVQLFYEAGDSDSNGTGMQ